MMTLKRGVRRLLTAARTHPKATVFAFVYAVLPALFLADWYPMM